ncbi:MAG: hypothetical protein M5R41_19135 [Bacteroidia bacterium]|nr:hypothetical protein [Bacteroidia bacterium]
MSSRFLVIVVISLGSVLAIHSASAQKGQRMTFVLQSDTVMHAILLLATDSALYVDAVNKSLYRDAVVRICNVRVLPLGDIRYVIGRGSAGSGGGAAVAGLLAGGLLGLLSYEKPSGGGGFMTLDFGPGPPIVLGAAAGLGFGLLVDAAIKPEARENNPLYLMTDTGVIEKLRDVALHSDELRVFTNPR